MPQSITIPTSIDEAVEQLGDLGDLITARKWERAAIVAAFVRLAPGRGRQHPDLANPRTGISLETPEQFAQRDIVGLSSQVSVTKYVQAWLDVHDGKYPRPGATRRLPTSGFPPMRTGTDGYETPAGAEQTLDRLIDRHGADAVAEHVATRAPRETARAVTRVPAASAAADQERARVRDIYDRSHEQYERIGSAIDDATTAHERSDLGEHGSERDLRSAAAMLRRAVESLERNPEPTEGQRERMDETLAFIDHLLRLLRGGTTWTAEDLAWLRDLDIDEGV